jgi:hypothetical protein
MRRDHALWLMAPSFIRGILSLEVDKRFAVTLFQESCGLCKWHRDHHRGFGSLSASCHHDTVACTLKREGTKKGVCMNCWLREWWARQINDSPRLRRCMTMVPPGFKTETENLLRIAIVPDESKEAAIRLLKAIQAQPFLHSLTTLQIQMWRKCVSNHFLSL